MYPVPSDAEGFTYAPGVLIHDMLDAVQSCMHPELPLAVRYEVAWDPVDDAILGLSQVDSLKKLRWYDRDDLSQLVDISTREKQQLQDTIAALRQARQLPLIALSTIKQHNICMSFSTLGSYSVSPCPPAMAQNAVVAVAFGAVLQHAPQ